MSSPFAQSRALSFHTALALFILPLDDPGVLCALLEVFELVFHFFEQGSVSGIVGKVPDLMRVLLQISLYRRVLATRIG